MLASVLGILLVAALGAGSAAASEGGPMSVVATVYPLADWAARVGGDRVAVTNLVPAGADAHGLEPTPADLRRLRQATVVLTLGAGFQPAVDRALRTPIAGQVRLVASEGLAPRRPSEGGDARDDDLAYDPHFWLDPVLARQVVGRIAGVLAEADPAGAAAYAANARAYQAQLDALHDRYARTLGSCAHRRLVTAHAAFGYLAARYGLEQVAIAGLSPEAEPRPRRLAELTRLVKAHGIRYIFTETLASRRAAETLARETGATLLVLHTLESLSEGELARGKDYLAVMGDNLEALATGLECRRP